MTHFEEIRNIKFVLPESDDWLVADLAVNEKPTNRSDEFLVLSTATRKSDGRNLANVNILVRRRFSDEKSAKSIAENTWDQFLDFPSDDCEVSIEVMDDHSHSISRAEIVWRTGDLSGIRDDVALRSYHVFEGYVVQVELGTDKATLPIARSVQAQVDSSIEITKDGKPISRKEESDGSCGCVVVGALVLLAGLYFLWRWFQ